MLMAIGVCRRQQEVRAKMTTGRMMLTVNARRRGGMQ